MNKSAWHRSLATLLIASVVLPPLGLALLWMRPGTRVLRKVLGSVLIAALTVAHLVLFFGITKGGLFIETFKNLSGKNYQRKDTRKFSGSMRSN